MPIDWRIALIWACFLARLAFYSTMLPLWEGYDEWAHFAVIRTMATRGEPLVARDQPVPRDVAMSLELAPVPWELRDLPPPSVTQDVYWSLPAEARAQREAAFHSMPSEWSRQPDSRFTAYEALQPPLYYWLLTPIMRLMSHRSLPAQVLALRSLSIAIASCIVPLIFWIGRMTFREDRLALCCASVVALMPGLALDVARVGNDSLAVALFTLLIAIGLAQIADAGDWRLPVAMGAVLGLGLLTKAYFLTAVPAVLLLEVWILWNRRPRKFLQALAPLILATGISGWWYCRNLLTTGTLSGLSEAVMLGDTGVFALFRRAAAVPWRTAIDAILFSHIYFGGWSSLTVRSWMYHVFYLVIALSFVPNVAQTLVSAASRLISTLFAPERHRAASRRTSRPAVWWLLIVYAAFWAGQIYNVLLLYATKALAGSMGWYLFGVVGAEAVLCTIGLSRVWRWAPASGAILFGLLDLYTVHAVAIPYYTGIIVHRPTGAIAALHIASARAMGLTNTLQRLTVYKGISPLFVMLCWAAYVCATLCLMASPFSPPSVNDESFR